MSTNDTPPPADAGTCRICGAGGPVGGTGRISNGYELVCCPSCETVMVERQPRSEELTGTYNHMFEDGAYEHHRREFDAIVAGRIPRGHYRTLLLRQAENRVGGRKLVEIGGGTGAFGFFARSRGWDYTDYDISEVAVNYARKLSLDAHLFNVDELPPLSKNSADAIVMWEVIEHIWAVREYLRVIGDALRPGGAFLFSTPNYKNTDYQKLLFRGYPSAPPVHVNFFSGESISKTLMASGLFDRPRIVKRRFYRPNLNLEDISRFLRATLFMTDAWTIYGIAFRV